jgi:glycosyltransferase involved in cell wall biosynthesis
MTPRVSVVIPVANEESTIIDTLDRIFESVTLPCEVLVVYDTPQDKTAAVLAQYSMTDARVKPTMNTHGRGPANAIRFGIEAAIADVVVVTMADGSDDPQQIDALTRLVERGVVVAAASRYMPGGQQVGGPALKGFLSRLAGTLLYYFCRIGTRDATNSFKAYSRQFIEAVKIDSRYGFEIGLELTSKAKRLRLPIAEVPTIWLDRQAGISQFQLATWIPHYLRWFLFAFGPKLTSDSLRSRIARRN